VVSQLRLQVLRLEVLARQKLGAGGVEDEGGEAEREREWWVHRPGHDGHWRLSRVGSWRLTSSSADPLRRGSTSRSGSLTCVREPAPGKPFVTGVTSQGPLPRGA
jgi:hypothetical protein